MLFFISDFRIEKNKPAAQAILGIEGRVGPE